MEYATIMVLLALLQYIWFTLRVGSSRAKYNVSAPACDGDEAWNRLNRVHQNTLEQLVVMIPGTFAFAYYVSGTWVVAVAGAFIIGRFLYSAAYLKDPKKRAPGMMITLLSNVVLVLGTLIALVMHMF